MNYKNGLVPMSSTSFQFSAILGACSSNPDCSNVPQFTNSLEPSNSVIAIAPGSFLTRRVEAFSIGYKVTEIRIFKDFVGFNYNQAVLGFDSTTNISYYDFNITISDPSKVYTGKAIFQAVDDAGAMSVQRVITFLFNVITTTTTTTTTTTATTTTTEKPKQLVGIEIILISAALGSACCSACILMVVFCCRDKLFKKRDKNKKKDDENKYRRPKKFLR